MQFEEYPKTLYPAGDEKQEPVIVKDAKEEKAARAKGNRPVGETETAEK